MDGHGCVPSEVEGSASWSRAWQSTAPGLNVAHCLVLSSPQAENGFHFYTCFFESKKEFYVVAYETYEIQISTTIDEALLGHGHVPSSTCCPWLLSPQRQSQGAAPETIRPAKPTLFTLRPLKEQFVDPWTRVTPLAAFAQRVI